MESKKNTSDGNFGMCQESYFKGSSIIKSMWYIIVAIIISHIFIP